MPGGDVLEAGDHAQRRGLAAARRTEHREELAVFDVERQIVDRGDFMEALGYTVETNVGLCQSAPHKGALGTAGAPEWGEFNHVATLGK